MRTEMQKPYRYNWSDKDIISLDIKIEDKIDVIKLLNEIKKLVGILDILSFKKYEKYDKSYSSPLRFEKKNKKWKII